MIDFKNLYNQQDFLTYLIEYYPDFEPKKEGLQIYKKFKFIKSVIKLGKSKKLDLDVYEIEHVSENDPRVTLSKEAFSILREYIARKSLVIFKNENTQNYRLSLITFQSTWESGNKITTEFSNPRRYSFFLGPDAKVKTPTRFLIDKGKIIDFEDLKNRFSLEVVNKEFYKDISEQFIKLVGGSLSKGKKKIEYQSLLKLPSISDKSQKSVEFAVRLIGRVIFCWFLREKKSLNRKSLVPKDLLSYEASEGNADYYHKILEPIFFEILNKQIKTRRDEFISDLFSSIPYLNGGLFSPQDDDFYKRNSSDFQSQYHNTLVIPDQWFTEFFEVLETYNFTIDENTSFDEELSIDPEMLGRIFENLLAEINPETGESARKSTGSYYTPRVIVDYMVDESLLLYLKEQTKIDETKLRAIISYDLDDDTNNPTTDEERQKIVNALEKVKILDPACGSGAFPIGALQKIVFILQQIDPNGKLWKEKQLAKADPEFRKDIEKRFSNKEYNFIRKLGIIRDCIYGIDIQPIATEISRLRCFLTLIVDEQIDDTVENRGIKPLPNLDFKFVTANSLIGLPKVNEPQGTMFDDYQKINELKKIRDEYFNSSGIEREQLKTQFVTQQKLLFKDLQKEHGWQGISKAELTNKLTDWDPFIHKSTPWFDPEWMFGIKDGFDIVIANPPYVRADKPEIKEQRDLIMKSKTYQTLYEKWDLYVAFIERGYQSLRQNGVLEFIIPDAYMASKYSIKSHNYFIHNAIISRINFLNDLKIFDATVKNIIIEYKKGIKPDNIPIKIKHSPAFQDFIPLASKSQKEIGEFAFKIENENKNIGNLNNTIHWGEICYVSYGVAQSSDEVNFKGLFKKDDVLSDIKDKDHPRGYIEGKYIDKYAVLKTKYIEWNTDRSPSKWRRQTFPELYLPEKIMHGGISSGAVLDKEQLMCNHSMTVSVLWKDLSGVDNRSITGSIQKYFKINDDILRFRKKLENNSKNFNLKYLLAILNSKLAKYYLNQVRRSQIGFYPDDLKTLPIKIIGGKEQNKFIELVDQILEVKKFNPVANIIDLANQIDQIVYKLYVLTKEEIEVVERTADPPRRI